MIKGKVKVLLLGSASTGKTTILNVYYRKNYYGGPTVGIEVSSCLSCSRNVNGDGVKCPIRFYDMGGSRCWWWWIPDNLPKTDVVFLFYDITNRKTLGEMDEILTILFPFRDKFRIILVGNKTDLETQRKIRLWEIQEIIQKWRYEGLSLSHIETSVRNIISFKTILNKITFGFKNITVPKDYRVTDFNLNKPTTTLSWGDYIFNST